MNVELLISIIGVVGVGLLWVYVSASLTSIRERLERYVKYEQVSALLDRGILTPKTPQQPPPQQKLWRVFNPDRVSIAEGRVDLNTLTLIADIDAYKRVYITPKGTMVIKEGDPETQYITYYLASKEQIELYKNAIDGDTLI